MNEIAKEYGTALFMVACEKNEKKSFADALDLIKSTFLDYPEYLEILTSPSIPQSERLGVIEKTFSDVVPEYVLSYLMLLCEKGRISFFMDSVEEYNALLCASEHISNAKITSATELTQAEKEKLIAKLELIEKSKIYAEYFVDNSLLGGLIVEVDGKIMDGSLRHYLHEVKEVMYT